MGSNETEGRFRRLMQMRMDMNATEIHNSCVIHVVEAGFSAEPPMSCDAELKYKEWETAYNNFNVTDEWFKGMLLQKMQMAVASELETPLYVAFYPLAAYEYKKRAKAKCLKEATEKVRTTVNRFHNGLDRQEEQEKKGDREMAATLGAEVGVDDKVIGFMKKIKEKVDMKGTKEMKAAYNNALARYIAAEAKLKLKPTPSGAMALAVQCATDMNKQLDIVSTTWADPVGAQIMEWKLAIKQLRNPAPKPGSFDN